MMQNMSPPVSQKLWLQSALFIHRFPPTFVSHLSALGLAVSTDAPVTCCSNLLFHGELKEGLPSNFLTTTQGPVEEKAGYLGQALDS